MRSLNNIYKFGTICHVVAYLSAKTCVREPPLRLTLNSGWCGKSCRSYKGTYHVILFAKLHDVYLYKTTIFPHQPLRSISKVALLHRFYCIAKRSFNGIIGKCSSDSSRSSNCCCCCYCCCCRCCRGRTCCCNIYLFIYLFCLFFFFFFFFAHNYTLHIVK